MQFLDEAFIALERVSQVTRQLLKMIPGSTIEGRARYIKCMEMRSNEHLVVSTRFMANAKRILLVEDNLDNLSIYTTILEFTGFEVLIAKDGLQGLATARKELPDLILMDIAIPGVDGWEATRRLKADSATRDIPVIVLTAYAQDGDGVRALSAGAEGYIAKPADPMSVVNAIRKALGNPRAAEESRALDPTDSPAAL